MINLGGPIGLALGYSVSAAISSVLDWRSTFWIEAVVVAPLATAIFLMPTFHVSEHQLGASLDREAEVELSVVETEPKKGTAIPSPCSATSTTGDEQPLTPVPPDTVNTNLGSEELGSGGNPSRNQGLRPPLAMEIKHVFCSRFFLANVSGITQFGRAHSVRLRVDHR